MRKIKYFVMDVDGTLTDGKIYMGDAGEMFKSFDIKDGYGIRNILLPEEIKPIVLTGRQSKIVQNRCKELGITLCYQGVEDKLSRLRELISANDFSCTAYIGDDLNDLPCMSFIKAYKGLIGCPADAVKQVKEISDFVSEKNGGNGAVREFIDWIVKDVKTIIGNNL